MKDKNKRGKPVTIYLAGDLLDWYDAIPYDGKRSETICQAIRECPSYKAHLAEMSQSARESRAVAKLSRVNR
jgi:hypothetical protein